MTTITLSATPFTVTTDNMFGDELAELLVSHPRLFLRAYGYADDWNGWTVPVVTADDLRDYFAAWASNDPNGSWSTFTVTEGDGALIVDDAEFDARDVFTVCGMIAGKPVYRLDMGWTFIRTDEYLT